MKRVMKSKMNRRRGPKMYEAKSSAISFSWRSKIQVPEIDLKHTLVLEFLKSDEMFEIGKMVRVATTKQATNRTNACRNRHHSEKISHSVSRERCD